jgi:rfaE bifunctional protein nucleotidyltransferase chain/domain
MKKAKLNFKKKIFSPKKLELFVQTLKRKKTKVVFTNGCFDLLHPGHVTYLEMARNKGDFLIVALDTDESVRSLKGPERPINSLESRMQVMASLESVGAVTWFENSDPRTLLEKLRPNILVKGGDWKVNEILGAKEVMSWGGKVFSLNFVPGKSTTEMIHKIRSKVSE